MNEREDSKRLYFIPLLARAIESGDQKQAMKGAFDEIEKVGNQPGYEEGFQQFQEFIKSAFSPSDEESNEKIRSIRNAIYRLIYDLVTDSFEGDENLKDAFISAIKRNPRWNAEYERLESEMQDYLAPDSPIQIEILRENQVIDAVHMTAETITVSPIFPGQYTMRFSNGRILWEGDLTREDLIWTYAYPDQDISMAAETEDFRQEPVKTISLLDGEIVLRIFAGLESGRIILKIERNT
jgi:hypothetical protein